MNPEFILKYIGEPAGQKEAVGLGLAAQSAAEIAYTRGE